MNRRNALKTLLASSVALLDPVIAAPPAASATRHAAALIKLEREFGGRIGVAIVNLDTGRQLRHHAEQRFLLCSTFKVLLVGAVLARIDAGHDKLGSRVVFGKESLLAWSPVTQLHSGPPGMSVQALCAAALMMSDNMATNLLLERVDGPAGVTAFARSLGDATTRVDNGEPDVNIPDGEHNISTPAAVLGDLRKLLLDDVLGVASRSLLTGWLVHNLTGSAALRAGLPVSWRVGDKAGSNQAMNNDVAIAWPAGRKPLLISAYVEHPKRNARKRNAVLVRIAAIARTL